MLQPLIELGSPRKFYYLCYRTAPYFAFLTIATMGYGLWAGLFWAPSDYQQGEAYRIIYVHVPCAIFSMAIYCLMAVQSAIYLIWRIKMAEIIASAVAPIGAVITLLALITGSLWGKPMWGTWWIWDARLTSELILLFLYLGYMVLYQSIAEPQVRAKITSLLTLVGVVDIPIIHYSVYWWNTLHQGATITKWGQPSIAPQMLYPLLSMIVGLGLFIAFCTCIRIQTEIIKRNFEKHWVKVMVKKWKS